MFSMFSTLQSYTTKSEKSRGKQKNSCALHVFSKSVGRRSCNWHVLPRSCLKRSWNCQILLKSMDWICWNWRVNPCSWVGSTWNCQISHESCDKMGWNCQVLPKIGGFDDLELSGFPQNLRINGLTNHFGTKYLSYIRPIPAPYFAQCLLNTRSMLAQSKELDKLCIKQMRLSLQTQPCLLWFRSPCLRKSKIHR